ncbi:MAG: hypothetical protein JW889_08095 [Verrucomicrobia bacterium]|nr:hypothetical protein [Verrucomicrobiota bacterium]
MGFWATFAFQALNFFALVAILYYFLYKPVRQTMQQREQQIQGRYEEAEAKIRDADDARAKAEAKQREIDAKRTQLLDEAKEDARQRGEAMLADARKEADRLIGRAREAIRREWTQAADALGETLSRTVVALCAQALGPNADALTAGATREVVGVVERLEGADLDEARRAAARGPVVLKAAGAVPDDTRKQLADALGTRLGGGPVEVRVEQDESLVVGVELALGTLRIRSHWRQRLEQTLADARAELVAAAPYPESETSEDDA